MRIALALLLVASSAYADECRAIGGADPLLASRTIVVLGEWHGTVETPEALYRFACAAAARKLPVVVGYEIDGAQQPAIDRFFTDGDPAPLLATIYGFGSSDGRGSRAMLDLLRRLKALREAGADVRFEAMLLSRGARKTNDETSYEGGMAKSAARAHAKGAFVVLAAGANHTQSKTPNGVGARLRAVGLPVLALEVTSNGGTAWYCDESLRCRENPVLSDDKRPAWVIKSGPSPDAQHDGVLPIGRMHASPPARP
jgi:hypothetical protein